MPAESAFPLVRHSQIGIVSALACVSALLVSAPAQAARHYVLVEEYPTDEEPRSHLDLAFDGEGAVPLGIPRSPIGNDVSGGGGFKVRVGDQIHFFPRLRLTPEIVYGYDHLFATDIVGNSYAWDMHRVVAGARIGVGRIVVPTFYAHLGYGWRDTADPTVAEARGLAFDAGFALDLYVIRHLGVGGHVEYAAIDATPYTPRWLALGLHADLVF